MRGRPMAAAPRPRGRRIYFLTDVDVAQGRGNPAQQHDLPRSGGSDQPKSTCRLPVMPRSSTTGTGSSRFGRSTTRRSGRTRQRSADKNSSRHARERGVLGRRQGRSSPQSNWSQRPLGRANESRREPKGRIRRAVAGKPAARPMACGRLEALAFAGEHAIYPISSASGIAAARAFSMRSFSAREPYGAEDDVPANDVAGRAGEAPARSRASCPRSASPLPRRSPRQLRSAPCPDLDPSPPTEPSLCWRVRGCRAAPGGTQGTFGRPGPAGARRSRSGPPRSSRVRGSETP